MQIYLCKQGEPGQLTEVKNELKDLQETVGGYIEVVRLQSNLILICNDESKLNGSLPNRWCRGDIICGDFFFCGVDGEDFCDVPEDLLPVINAFYGPPQYDKEGERIGCRLKKTKS